MAINMKMVSLVLLTVQNCSQMLLMRSSLVHSNYITKTAVVMQESIKLVASLALMVVLDGERPGQVLGTVFRQICGQPMQTLKMAVPGLLYTVQNNLLYTAINNLDAATASVLYQLKLLTTAVFTVTFLRRRLSKAQWFALLVLFIGAACVEYNDVLRKQEAALVEELAPAAEEAVSKSSSPITGLLAVVAACCTSGAAGVYLELMLKSVKTTSLWLKNVQLAMFGVVFGLIGVWYYEADRVAEHGFFTGYGMVVWLVILDVSCGGLLVAVVVKYADNLSKGFATSVSIVASTIISTIWMGLQLTGLFFVGALLVLTATALYARAKSVPAPPLPAAGKYKASDVKDKSDIDGLVKKNDDEQEESSAPV